MCRGCVASRKAHERYASVAPHLQEDQGMGTALLPGEGVQTQEQALALILNGFGLTAHEIGVMNDWLNESAIACMIALSNEEAPMHIVLHGHKLQGVVFGLWLAKTLQEHPEPNDKMGHE